MGIGLYGIPVSVGTHGRFRTGFVRDCQGRGQSIGTWFTHSGTRLDLTTGLYGGGKGRGRNYQVLAVTGGTPLGTKYSATGLECSGHWREYIGTHHDLERGGDSKDVGYLTVSHTESGTSPQYGRLVFDGDEMGTDGGRKRNFLVRQTSRCEHYTDLVTHAMEGIGVGTVHDIGCEQSILRH